MLQLTCCERKESCEGKSPCERDRNGRLSYAEVPIVQRRICDRDQSIDGFQRVRVKHDEEEDHYQLTDKERLGLRPYITTAK